MRLLLIGSGGREHAIARKLAKNSDVEKIYCAPGNGGTHIEAKCENINIYNFDELINFAKNEDIYMTIVGPEQPLIEGIVDKFKEHGLKIFGPSKAGAMLEGSKAFSKRFMDKYNVKTARYKSFIVYEEALLYVKGEEYPLVIKADGIAAGKGVYICNNLDEATVALKEIMLDKIFGDSGNEVVVEEFLDGVEASILSITDGDSIIPFISAKDHKQIFDEGKGPNTGGMGVIAPNPYVTENAREDFEKNIMLPTLSGLKEENLDFIGIIFFGIMITKKGTYLLEYNVRMGDPETQSVLELMNSDLLELFDYALNKRLKDFNIEWTNEVCCNVVLASGGYPRTFKKGLCINLDKGILKSVYIAGATYNDDNLFTSGGRVLSVIGKGINLEDARKSAYEKIQKVSFEHMYHRSDIGKF